MQLGFVGMGIMGSAMARNLLRAGHAVCVWNRTREKCAAAEAAGATVAGDLTELAEKSDIIFICVSDTPDVEAVLLAENGLLDGLSEGKTIVDHSTISPDATEEFARQVNEHGCDYLDAPVSGGQKGAEEGALTIMAGGDEAVFTRLQPFFEAMGRNIVYCGRQGNGQRVKAVNQVICGLNILACSEGMLFARRMGLDLSTVHRVVSGGAAASWMLDNLAPKMIEGDFAPGFMIRLQAKDLNIALDAMQRLEADFPGTELTADLFDDCVEQGLGEEGTQGLVKLLGWDD